jgi:CrcB protein
MAWAGPGVLGGTEMDRVLWVCLGGAVGSGGRYLLDLGAAHWLGAAWPYGTWLANLSGSFLLGLLLQVMMEGAGGSPNLRLALTTGAMGGFTTYSTFNYQVLTLVESGRWGAGLGYLGATVAGCLVAGFLGMALGRVFGS